VNRNEITTRLVALTVTVLIILYVVLQLIADGPALGW
jgi:hypothetical protein